METPGAIDFENIEEVDGVRLPWNCFPTTKLDSTNLPISLSCLYTPLKEKDDLIIVNDNPVIGGTPNDKGPILNPFCFVDTKSGTWTCPISLSRNAIPKTLLENPETLEKIMNNTTIEYVLQKQVQFSQIYLIIIDISTEYDELLALKDSILSSLSILPEDALIGLITFGKHVNVYNLQSNDTNSIVYQSFNGEKLYAMRDLRDKLGLISDDLKSPKLNTQANYIGSRYFQPLNHCEFQLQLILDNLLEDSFPCNATKERKLRATGSCLSLAINLLEACFPKTGVEVLGFLSGPCNYGKFGQITTKNLKDHLRSHRDIQNHNKNYNESTKIFYDELAKRASKHGYITNFFIGSFDQVGLFEMSSLCDKSGGSLIFSDNFKTTIFKNSFIKFLQNQTNNEEDEDENPVTPYGLNGSLEIKTSRNLKINGLIGQAVSLNKKTVNVSDTVIGLGETNSWKLPKTLNNTTFSIYFEIDKSLTNQNNLNNNQSFIQFIFYYQHPDGNFRLRVTTISRPNYNFNENKQLFINSFDQEAAIVSLAREISFKIFNELKDPIKIIETLDLKSIHLMKNFATINGSNLELNGSLSMLPQFVYNLRRSFLLRLFNYSPDESTYYNHILTHEDVNNSLIIIQPTLMSFEQDPDNPDETIIEPVLLDSTSIKPTRILLLDTFFEVLIYHGETIANWKSQGYQNDPEYEHFANFLKKPREEVTNILIDRFPLPRFIDTNEGGSQSRFLYSKLNPTNSYNNQNIYGGGGAVLLTDDVSLQKFLEEITKKVIAK